MTVTRGPVLPGATIGIVGGGQLGRMFALEARRLGYRTVVLDPGADAPAAQVADEHLRAPFTDVEAARELARRGVSLPPLPSRPTPGTPVAAPLGAAFPDTDAATVPVPPSPEENKA